MPHEALAAAPGKVWQTVLLRAAVTLVFAFSTVFWTGPTTRGMSLALGLYLLALAGTHSLTLRALDLKGADIRGRVLLLGAGIMAAAGILVALIASDAGAVWAVGVALVAGGLAELVAFLRTSKTSAGPARGLRLDWLLSAVVGLGTGGLIPFFLAAGPHGILGVAGGGALLSGVLWTLSAFTLRHDDAQTKSR